MKIEKTKLRCLNCGKTWLPKKKSPKCCPQCHSTKFEFYTEFTPLKDKLKPKQFPYRKNWGKDAKSVPDRKEVAELKK